MVDSPRLAECALVVFDFDGVLTDNTSLILEDGTEGVVINRSDGWAFDVLRAEGLETLILSTEKNPVVAARARKVRSQLLQGVEEKGGALEAFCREHGIPLSRVLFVGNDVNDLTAMKRAGLSACPADAHPEIRRIASFPLASKGGAGVAREVADRILAARSARSGGAALPSPSPLPGAAEEPPTDFLPEIRRQIEASRDVKDRLLAGDSPLLLSRLAAEALRALAGGGKLLFVGNGGSFSDALHLTAEFVVRFRVNREPISAVTLGANPASLTATGNDFDFREIFLRDLKALGRPGDLLVALSTSGNSENVLVCIDEAAKRGIAAYGLSGAEGGKLAGKCPTIRVPSNETARIQECHILLGHILCDLVERRFPHPVSPSKEPSHDAVSHR